MDLISLILFVLDRLRAELLTISACEHLVVCTLSSYVIPVKFWMGK